MSGLFFLLDFAGYAALLLWGVHMIQTGVQRAFGASLGTALGHALATPARAFGAGLAITAALQSSTAAGLMVAGFTANGVVALAPALAAMLGANVGTTLIVQLLSFDLGPLIPVFILAGVWMFRRHPPGRAHDLGRVFIGLGLLLLALHQLVFLFRPLERAPMLDVALQALAGQPVIAVLLAAALTWAAHSSVAVVAVLMSMSSHGLLSLPLACTLVLGANLGTAINPVLEGVAGSDPAARRLPLGNLLTRVAGVAAGLLLLPWLPHWLSAMTDTPARAVANFHTLFNVVIAVVFLPWLTPYAALLVRWLPRRPDPDDPAQPRYLDEWAQDIPSVALGNATREALRMTDMLQTLLLYARAGLRRDNRHRLPHARQLDHALDQIQNAITAHLAALDPDAMTPEDHHRRDDILAFASNVGHAGDLACHVLAGHLAKLRKQGWHLSAAQRAELDDTLARLIRNQRQAAALLVNDDLRQARALASQKTLFRRKEARASETQWTRLRTGETHRVEIDALYLDILRDVKSINSHLVRAAAYPLLARHGELLPSRLRQTSL